jgi:Tfp pilus assembly protein PilP
MKPSLAALAFGVLFSGCSVRSPEAALLPTPPRSLAPATSAPVPAVKVKAQPAPIPSYTYVPSGKRDPFRVDFDLPPPPPSPRPCEEPLCRYGLDELKLTGTVSGMGRPVAVLESPRGKGYSVYPGSRIGKHGGVVKHVLRDAVVVVESWPDGQGRSREEETVLRMREDAPITLDE